MVKPLGAIEMIKEYVRYLFYQKWDFCHPEYIRYLVYHKWEFKLSGNRSPASRQTAFYLKHKALGRSEGERWCSMDNSSL